MPIKGDVKKDFIRLREQVKHSVMESAKFMIEQTLAAVRRDGIIDRDNSVVEVFKKRGKGKKARIYIEIPEANVFSRADRTSYRRDEDVDAYAVRKGKSRAGRRVFHNTKFIRRSGDLLKALTPAGPWWGDKLNMLGKGHAEVEKTASGARGKITIEGRPAMALKKGSKDKDIITVNRGLDENGIGHIDHTMRLRRRIFDNAIRSVKGLWNTRLKKDLDKIARDFFK